jgi:RNA polymerase sigma-70 factor (ECF subfamily)
LKQGDRKALGILYDQYNEALFGTAYSIVKDEYIAQEILQDSFLKIWNHIRSYDAEKGRLFTWMLNIVRHTAIDKLRSKEIIQKGKTKSIDPFVHIKDSFEQKTDSIGLDNVINQLDNDHRSIINLIYFQGYTHSEASDYLDVPLGTIKTRVRNALIKMRKYLKT